MLAGQAQRELFVNECLARIDGLLHAAIEGVANAPPAEPGEGQCWLVGTSPTGVWTGQGGRLALYQSGQWLFQPARDGMRLLDRSNGVERRFAGEWRMASRPALPSGGTTVDTEARSALSALIDSLGQAGILPAT
ncbi:MAG: DUF2793 domain-containing protein [Sphingomonadaceae bacterium]|jgi:Protein of unknown function (DUF2793)|nr:DUF2793 domain-containing protein [Sphingomonadaceae bacterium]